MSFFQAEDGAVQAERRDSTRFSFEAPVQLKMPSGVKQGRLADISEGGAKIAMPNPPAKGATVLLSWGANEEFCKVVWVAGESCGIQFERRISRAIVLETTGQQEEISAGPIANRDKIPAGRKRQRLGSGG